jgi:CheY-like chemotaxis protein
MPDVDGFMLTRRIRQDRRFARTRIVMLTSMGPGDGAARATKAGVDAHLNKPVKHSDLLDTLARVFGAATHYERQEPETSSLNKRPHSVLRVLVAEDNPVNRKLVTTILKKRGHNVTAVENGRAAVNAIAENRHQFDVVLMDLQMPEMSGLEAAAAIRAREASGVPRLPLIALTAHAMQGDRERCLAAGMDGYLSKPIDLNKLIATLEWFGDGAARDQAPEPPQTGAPVFDERVALACTGGDRRLLKRVVGMFRSSCPTSLRRIERALRRKDAEEVRLAAHALKGAIATVGSPAGREAAAELEQLAREGNLSEAASAYATLRARITQLDAALVGAALVARSKRRAGRRKQKRS